MTRRTLPILAAILTGTALTAGLVITLRTSASPPREPAADAAAPVTPLPADPRAPEKPVATTSARPSAPAAGPGPSAVTRAAANAPVLRPLPPALAQGVGSIRDRDLVDDDPLCKTFAEEESTRLLLLAKSDTGGKAPDGLLLPARSITCKAFSGGAWGASITRGGFKHYGDDHAYESDGTWSLVHIDATGKRTTRGGAPDRGGASFTHGIHGIPPSTYFDIRVLADYDHDGVPEVMVFENAVYPEGDSSSGPRWIYSLHGGKIARYAPASRHTIADLRDVDGDGRPDILVSLGRLNGYETCLGTRTMDAFLWAAHATDTGEFDLTDSAALAHARATCAGRAPGILQPGDRAWNLGATAKAMVCARLDGVSAAAIRAEVTAACDTFAPSLRFCESPPKPRTCPSWFRTLPDLRLPVATGSH